MGTSTDNDACSHFKEFPCFKPNPYRTFNPCVYRPWYVILYANDVMWALHLSGIAFWRIRVLRRKSIKGNADVADRGDVERQRDKWLAPSTNTPLALDTVAAPAGVGWTPQFRSISGPEYVREAAKESKPLPPKRSRSPPPSLVSIPSQDPFADPRPKSAPPRSPGTREVDRNINVSSPSSPQPYALSVSGYQVRGLWTKEKGTRDWDV